MATYKFKTEGKIEAIQWTGDNIDEVMKFGDDTFGYYNRCLFINNPTKQIPANVGEYIIRNPDGTFRTAPQLIFEMTYEEVK